MPELIAFTRNYNDLSDESGFQFEFNCDRCGDGYRSTFKRSVAGTASGALEVASGLFGGLLSGASDVAGRVREAAHRKEWEVAFKEAQTEVRSLFQRCPRCTHYVCKSCWNEEAGLCMDCAPKLAQEIEATRADVAVQQMQEKMQQTRVFSGDVSRRQTVCPNCGKPVGSEKFCSECGTPLQLKKCPKCGAEVTPTMKFCSECGTKMR